MYLAVKDTKIIAVHELEWQCRRKAKNLNGTEYWAWLESVTSEDENGVKSYDFSGEDYEIIETGNDALKGFTESGHIQINPEPGYKGGLHLKWDGTKIVKDDEAKAAWELAWEWTLIRRERTRLLAETDWVVIKARENGGQVPAAWKTYRVGLRNIPSDQSDATKYSEITWPTKPS